jgi:competence ComEA-like helix-hairpin-helix protein
MAQRKNFFLANAFAVIALLYVSEPAGAEEWPVGARSLGMGATYVALSNTADAVFLNVGGLGQLSGTELSLFYQKPFGLSEINFGTVALSFPIWNRRIGLGAMSFGNNLYREQTLSLTYSHHYQRRLFYGVGLRYQTVHIEGSGSGGAVGFDVGIVVPLSAEINFGFVAKNVNRPTIGQSGEHAPQIFSSGVSVTPIENLILNFEIFKDVRFAAESRFGCEFKPLANLAIRAGAANHPSRFSAGFGVAIKRVAFDYAFFTHNALGLTHQTSLAIHFGKQSRTAPAEPKPVVEISPELLSRDSTESEPPAANPESPPSPQSGSILKINLNTAGIDELKTLPGIGESLARAILEFREQNGPYQKMDDLLKVAGIGKSKLERIKPFVTLESD